MKNQSQIQKELAKWARETVDVYNPMAKTTGLGYYTQSVLDRETLDPDLLILGINPGAAGGGIMNEEELLHGNPCFKGKSDEKIMDILFNDYDASKRRYGWDLMKKIRKMFEYAGKQTLNNLDKFVLSNMVYFGTAKQGLIPKEINQDVCAKQTLKLINILRPKVVLLLGDQTRDLFKMVANIAHMDELIPGYHIFYCFYNNHHIIAIYHTAYYRYYTNHNMKIIGSIIGYALDNSSNRIDRKQLDPYLSSLENPITPITRYTIPRIDKTEIVQQVFSSINLDAYKEKNKEKNHRYKLNEKYGITIAEKGYIAIRHIKYDYKGYENTQDAEVLAIREMLERRGFNTSSKGSEKAWIGTKTFSQFGHNDNDIIEGICKEIKELKEEIQKI